MTTPTGSPTTFAGMGKLEFAPSNGPDDPNPTWADITAYMETDPDIGGTPLDIIRGRQSELDATESSQLTCVLKNSDGRFTFGNTAGPYGSNWAPAKQIRYSEVANGQTFVLFTGWIEYPDIPSWQPIGQQYVQLTALDRQTRLGRGEPFVSTLAEWIEFNGGSSLVDYWPMNETAGPTLHPAVGSLGLTEQLQTLSGLATDVGLTTTPMVLYASGTAVLADEVPGVTYAPNVNASGSAKRWTRHFGSMSTPVTVTSGQTITLVCWINRTMTDAPDGTVTFSFGGNTSVLTLSRSAPTGTYVISAADETSGFLSLDSGLPTDSGIGAWRCIAVRLTEPSGLVEFWHHGDAPVTSTLPGSPSTAVMTDVRLGGAVRAQLAHLQIYVGAGAYTRAQHVAQVTAGYEGLEQQTTGQRINTILDYAGVPASLRQVDQGQSYMQATGLADQSPLQALQNAADTERGRLFISGDGKVVFHDRVRIYNV